MQNKERRVNAITSVCKIFFGNLCLLLMHNNLALKEVISSHCFLDWFESSS